MQEAEFFKCACKECGNNIEFPASAVRTTVACPHCGQWTELIAPEIKSKEPGLSIGLAPFIGGVVVLVAIIGGGIWWKHRQARPADIAAGNPSPKVVAAPIPKPAPTPANDSNQAVTQAVEQTAPKGPSRPKSPDDLKVGSIELEKTKGSSLVYAIGTVNNDSEYDRYGIRVELDLLNGKGAKIGTAKDYKDYIGPHQDWQFRALIPEPKTVKAQLASIKEDQ
jgi:hypothetical protein